MAFVWCLSTELWRKYDMDHVYYSFRGAVTFFGYFSLHAFVERDEVCLIGSFGPFASAVGCLSSPWNMNNQDQCDLTICCPYPTVLTAFQRKAACLSSLKHVSALFCDFWRESGTQTFFHQAKRSTVVQLASWQLWANGAHLYLIVQGTHHGFIQLLQQHKTSWFFLRLQRKLANSCQILPKYSYQFQPWVFDRALQQNVQAWFVLLQFTGNCFLPSLLRSRQVEYSD